MKLYLLIAFSIGSEIIIEVGLITWEFSLISHVETASLNSFVSSALFLYPLETLENHRIF